MKIKIIFIVSLLAITSVMAQDRGKFGLEVRSSRNITYNCCAIYGGFNGSTTYTIDNEKNLNSTSYSVGLVYRINERSMLKLHVGHHQNGRNFDLTERLDNFTISKYVDSNLPYYYLQFTPSYVYHLNLGKGKIPLEGGISINKRRNEAEIFFMPINEYNYDLRLAVGYEYPILPKLSAGVNAVYARALSPYQVASMVTGKYSPLQVGLEVNIKYFY